MYKFFIIIVSIVGLSCNKILDVKPDDKIIDSQVFSSRLGIENALNGLYLSMVSGETLYGGNLNATTIDILAQYYNVNQSNKTFYQTALYNYKDQTFITNSNGIWNSAYNIIFQGNIFIDKVKDATVIDSVEKKLLLGEVYGIRAYLMFDLLRLYGPMYSKDSSKMSIPINHNLSIVREISSTANIVLNSVIHDIDTAINYLENDPIKTEGIQATNGIGDDNFFSMRNRRFNYFGAKALLARVFLYQGNKDAAYVTAKELINECYVFFPFSPQSLSLPGISNPDRNFSSEILFGVLNPKLYNIQLNYFSSILTNDIILMPTDANLDKIYESNTNDHRFRVNWLLDPTTIRTSKTFYKYADIIDKSASFRYLQPLIRMSELYYIVAETTKNIEEAGQYLNTVRNSRGLISKNINSSNLRAEITKEYQKEFWGEGQLFYYYKRINQSSIINGTNSANISMDETKYVLPIPQSETNFQ